MKRHSLIVFVSVARPKWVMEYDWEFNLQMWSIALIEYADTIINKLDYLVASSNKVYPLVAVNQ